MQRTDFLYDVYASWYGVYGSRIILDGGEGNDNDGEGILDGAPWDGVWDYLLLAFAGGFAGLWSLKPELITEPGIKERIKRLIIEM